MNRTTHLGSALELPRLRHANAHFVTPRLAIGGDLDVMDDEKALIQLDELVTAGVTHILDARVECDDEWLVADFAPHVDYLHHGMDDAGQLVPDAWFDELADWATAAMNGGGVVLTHCHMGINRGPSAGFAVLLALGWDPVEAIDAIRAARPIAHAAYAEDALDWHHRSTSAAAGRRAADRGALARWRADHPLDVVRIIASRRR